MGFAVINGGELRINQLAVWGVDAAFGNLGRRPDAYALSGNAVAINETLATLAGLKVGDEMLLRLNKLNTFPANTPFVSEQEATVFVSCYRGGRFLNGAELGNFNLQNIQSTPRNVFMNLEWLNQQMGLQQKANALLIPEGGKYL